MEKQKNKTEEMDFMAKKATFVAGIVLIFTIAKDIIELFFTIPLWGVYCYIFLTLLISLVVLGTKKLDQKLNTKGVTNFGNFLTVASIIIFVVENSLIKYKEFLSCVEITGIILIGIVVIIGAICLLIAKH